MRRATLVLVGHGASADARARRSLRVAAAVLRARGIFREVRIGFWKGRPRIERAVACAQGPIVLIVPWLFSDGWFFRRVIPHALGLRGRVARREGRLFLLADPVGAHPDMAKAILRAAVLACRSTRGISPPRAQTTLIVVGHGTNRDGSSALATRAVVADLRRRNQWAQVLPAYLDQEPSARRVLYRVRAPFAVVVPFFAGDGPHVRRDLPRLMGLTPRDALHPPSNPIRWRKRLLVWRARALGTGPWMPRIVLDQARKALARARPAPPAPLAVRPASARRNRRGADLSRSSISSSRGRKISAAPSATFSE